MKLFLIGGFLGSGKTTAIKNASTELLKQNLNVGIITNDQGTQLVDSKYFQHFGFSTREVTDGCFCCNYRDLENSVESLLEGDNPDIIFAESVGSCTDIVSTVVNPFERFNPSSRVLVSVFADARVLPVLIQDESYFFDKKIHYIYQKQLDEADILIINKVDLLSEAETANVKKLAEDIYPEKRILYQNSLNGNNICGWIETLEECYGADSHQATPLEIDYDIYGEGEALLGWLNADLELHSKDAAGWGYRLINNIYQRICDEELPIGHLKFYMNGAGFDDKISFTQVNDAPVSDDTNKLELNSINMLVNARVESTPESLKKILYQAIEEIRDCSDSLIEMNNLSAFKPGFPEPTFQMCS